MEEEKIYRRRKKVSDFLNVVGDNIRYYRQLNKLSYQKLSDKLMLHGIDIHKQALYKIEKGQRAVVDYELCAIAKILDVSVDCLLKDFRDKLDKI